MHHVVLDARGERVATVNDVRKLFNDYVVHCINPVTKKVTFARCYKLLGPNSGQTSFDVYRPWSTKVREGDHMKVELLQRLLFH